MIKGAALFILWLVVWMLLSWPPGARDVIVGAIAALFVTVMTIDLIVRPAPRHGPAKLDPLGFIGRCAWFVLYIFVFVWECLKANIDVAYRVLHPDLPIRPGTVKVKIGLRSDIGLTLLASSVTLTPGTTTVDLDKDRGYLYVHCLYMKDDSGALPVVEKFEKILKRIFE